LHPNPGRNPFLLRQKQCQWIDGPPLLCENAAILHRLSAVEQPFAQEDMKYSLTIERPRPFFAELPYYLWGEVNYDSEGDCSKPTARDWTWIELTRRDTDEHIEITSEGLEWKVIADDPIAARTAILLRERCSAISELPEPEGHIGDWDSGRASARARRVAEEFSSPKLEPFDSHLFWGSWKWIGGFATESAWVGRYIMHSILTSDPRGVNLCVEWLRNGTFNEAQSKALRYALSELTGESLSTDRDWIKWYDGSLFRKEARLKYPAPDFKAWHDELQREYN
jgi:hypothetical protein